MGTENEYEVRAAKMWNSHVLHPHKMLYAVVGVFHILARTKTQSSSISMLCW